jgi:hypothetical protein
MLGVRAYDSGQYHDAVKIFREVVRLSPQLEAQVGPHIDICRRVLASDLTQLDHEYLVRLRDWASASTIKRAIGGALGFLAKPRLEIQCKHCGHFNRVEKWEHGEGYLSHYFTDPLSCNWCDRYFPLPDFVWDSVDGQAFIYYAHLVPEFAFYKEFETLFDVNPRMIRVGDRWEKEFAKEAKKSLSQDDGDASNAEKWGYELGRQWAAGLAVSDLSRIVGELQDIELADINRILPSAVSQQRTWRIESLLSDHILGAFEQETTFEFDFALRQAVWDVYMELPPLSNSFENTQN